MPNTIMIPERLFCDARLSSLGEAKRMKLLRLICLARAYPAENGPVGTIALDEDDIGRYLGMPISWPRFRERLLRKGIVSVDAARRIVLAAWLLEDIGPWPSPERRAKLTRIGLGRVAKISPCPLPPVSREK